MEDSNGTQLSLLPILPDVVIDEEETKCIKRKGKKYISHPFSAFYKLIPNLSPNSLRSSKSEESTDVSIFEVSVEKEQKGGIAFTITNNISPVITRKSYPNNCLDLNRWNCKFFLLSSQERCIKTSIQIRLRNSFLGSFCIAFLTIGWSLELFVFNKWTRK